MKYIVNISTDSLRICEGREVEAKSTMEAVLATLHHETSSYQHLRDLPMARLRIEAWPADKGLHMKARLSLNLEAGNCV